LKTRSFERAQQLTKQLEDGIQPKQEEKVITIQAALDAFIRDCETRNLNPGLFESIERYESVCSLSDRIAASLDVRISPRILSAIFVTLGISPQELLQKNSNASAPSSGSAKRTTGSPRTPRKPSKPRN